MGFIKPWVLMIVWIQLFRLAMYAGVVRNEMYLLVAILGSFFMLKMFPAFKTEE